MNWKSLKITNDDLKNFVNQILTNCSIESSSDYWKNESSEISV